MRTWYNEIDGMAAAWLRSLADAGQITPGDIDTRSIEEVRPDDVAGYERCHFFAGIGGWDLALQMAGVSIDGTVWTGSCPCQPFSQAGKKGAEDDPRHLWHVFFRLIAECRPAVVFGEQVASPLGRAWFAAVRYDLEKVGYAAGAADLCAAGVGAPHQRQRLYWGAVRLADADDAVECTGARGWSSGIGAKKRDDIGGRCESMRLADADSTGSQGHQAVRRSPGKRLSEQECISAHWHNCDWAHLRDDTWRPFEPGSFPLADGVPARVGRLRGYGNAIVPQLAAVFIEEFLLATKEVQK